jgi:hypothetical protein
MGSPLRGRGVGRGEEFKLTGLKVMREQGWKAESSTKNQE